MRMIMAFVSMSVMMIAVVMIMVVIVMMLMIMVGVIMLLVLKLIVAVRKLTILVLFLDKRLQLFARCGLVGNLCLGHDVIDDLLFEDRTADLDERLRLLAVEFKHLAFLAGKLTGAIHQPVAKFFVGD